MERVKKGGGGGLFLALAPFSAQAKYRKTFPPSFFAPKPHGNACYAGYLIGYATHYLFCGRRPVFGVFEVFVKGI